MRSLKKINESCWHVGFSGWSKTIREREAASKICPSGKSCSPTRTMCQLCCSDCQECHGPRFCLSHSTFQSFNLPKCKTLNFILYLGSLTGSSPPQLGPVPWQGIIPVTSWCMDDVNQLNLIGKGQNMYFLWQFSSWIAICCKCKIYTWFKRLMQKKKK